ncbi:conserved hypothetical protein [Ricinus communis]|uniref:Uncharacterized protein n=1 Tax=Ricinus communis TaxID=3988 RepID=B9RCL5_RICCO|nr:conserved hypothetical protein [Ricinus communis]
MVQNDQSWHEKEQLGFGKVERDLEKKIVSIFRIVLQLRERFLLGKWRSTYGTVWHLSFTGLMEGSTRGREPNF